MNMSLPNIDKFISKNDKINIGEKKLIDENYQLKSNKNVRKINLNKINANLKDNNIMKKEINVKDTFKKLINHNKNNNLNDDKQFNEKNNNDKTNDKGKGQNQIVMEKLKEKLIYFKILEKNKLKEAFNQSKEMLNITKRENLNYKKLRSQSLSLNAKKSNYSKFLGLPFKNLKICHEIYICIHKLEKLQNKLTFSSSFSSFNNFENKSDEFNDEIIVNNKSNNINNNNKELNKSILNTEENLKIEVNNNNKNNNSSNNNIQNNQKNNKDNMEKIDLKSLINKSLNSMKNTLINKKIEINRLNFNEKSYINNNERLNKIIINKNENYGNGNFKHNSEESKLSVIYEQPKNSFIYEIIWEKLENKEKIRFEDLVELTNINPSMCMISLYCKTYNSNFYEIVKKDELVTINSSNKSYKPNLIEEKLLWKKIYKKIIKRWHPDKLHYISEFVDKNSNMDEINYIIELLKKLSVKVISCSNESLYKLYSLLKC